MEVVLDGVRFRRLVCLSATLPLALLACESGTYGGPREPAAEVDAIRIRVRVGSEPVSTEGPGPIPVPVDTPGQIFVTPLDADGDPIYTTDEREWTVFPSDVRVVEVTVTQLGGFNGNLSVWTRSAGVARITVRHTRDGRSVSASVEFVVS